MYYVQTSTAPGYGEKLILDCEIPEIILRRYRKVTLLPLLAKNAEPILLHHIEIKKLQY
jgi:hypothetical protein